MKLATTKSYLVKGAATIGALAMSAQFAMAQTSASKIPAVPILSGAISTLVTNIINVILLAAGVLAVVYLIWGGLMYITAGGDAEKATKGRTAITNAIIGIIIIMASFAIYRAVVKPTELTGVEGGGAVTSW